MPVNLENLLRQAATCIDPKKDKGAYAYMIGEEVADHIAPAGRLCRALWANQAGIPMTRFTFGLSHEGDRAVSETCETCVYSQRVMPNGIGFCRRYAPRPILHSEGVDAEFAIWWPEFDLTDNWCGEHRKANHD